MLSPRYGALRACVRSSLWIPELPFARNVVEWIGASVMVSSGPGAGGGGGGGGGFGTPGAESTGGGALDVTITSGEYAEAEGEIKLPDWLSPSVS